ncbi:MAG: protein O-mannosyl-transferase family [Anaerolineae bacterium]
MKVPTTYNQAPDQTQHRTRRPLLIGLAFAAAVVLYVATLSPGTVFGDPAEYQFIPAIWGIAHPPGYAFYTLLAGVWQRVVVVGSVAYRTNLLAAFAGAWAMTRVVSMVLMIAPEAGDRRVRDGWVVPFSALVAGGAVAVAPDLWQQSIHANAHVVSVAITSTQLWMLVRWDRSQRMGWLYALALLVGVGIAHHPITVWGLPAYGLFIVLRRPRTVTEVRAWAGGALAGAAGLLPWLYFPLRSPTTPFGPTDMGTWEGFLRHATAQGLRVNLFHFGLADQPDRLQVFVSLLRLQYGWLLIGLTVLGLLWLAVERTRLAVLWGGFLVGHLAFTLNSVQDVMAYLLHPFVALGFPLGLGVLALVSATGQRRGRRWVLVALIALVVVIRGAWTFPRVSLRAWRVADTFVAALQERFAGEGEGAALVSDWEHLTPFFYHTLVGGLALQEEDLRPVYVTGATPWTESVFANLPQGPVYLTNYRRDVRELGFRLRPEGALWRVLEPPAHEAVRPQHSLEEAWVDDRLQLLGYDLPTTEVAQGDVVPIVLYATVPATETEILMPFALFGGIEQRWTTDSRRLTPTWRPGEIIAERYELFVPYDLPPGSYPLQLGYIEMAEAPEMLSYRDGDATLRLGTLSVREAPGGAWRGHLIDRSLTNVGNVATLRRSWTRSGLSIRRGQWHEPLRIAAGEPLHLRLTWCVLARPETSLTVFIHLIDTEGRPRFVHDYTPLGGAFPSYLWFPKWLAGQQMVDPYRLVLPDELPTGLYWLEVGMYEMGSIRRIPQLARDGTLTGDRYILGPVLVE